MKTFLTLAFILSTGCSELTLKRSAENPSVAEAKQYRLDAFFWGLDSGHPLPPEQELCPQTKIEAIAMKMETQDVLLTLVTIGVYVPHRVTITCRN